jgi:hypothetical protein
MLTRTDRAALTLATIPGIGAAVLTAGYAYLASVLAGPLGVAL